MKFSISTLPSFRYQIRIYSRIVYLNEQNSYRILHLGLVPNKFPLVEVEVERVDEFNKELFVCLPNAEGPSKRQQEWQPKEAAEEEDTSGAVPTEESPKTDEADAKPSGTSKYFIPKTPVFLASPAARHHYLRTTSCFHRLGHF